MRRQSFHCTNLGLAALLALIAAPPAAAAGPWPLGAHLDPMSRKPVGMNLAYLAGHNTIRRAVMGTANRARKAGTDVMMDQYPYTASQTSLDVLVPPWALEGGNAELRKRMANPALRDSVLKGVVDYLWNDRGGGDLTRVQFGTVTWDRTLEGKTLFDLVKRTVSQPTMETAAPIVVDAVLRGGAGMVYHIMDEGDVRRIMSHPMTMIASDGRLTRPGDGVPHPRSYGTFPRVLGECVRVQKVLTLEQAVN